MWRDFEHRPNTTKSKFKRCLVNDQPVVIDIYAFKSEVIENETVCTFTFASQFTINDSDLIKVNFSGFRGTARVVLADGKYSFQLRIRSRSKPSV